MLLGFTGNMIEWHLYEMLFGLVSAGIAGFLLTALPQFYSQSSKVRVIPFVGKPLLGLVSLWVFGRISFWLMGLMDEFGVIVTALSHIAFQLWLLWLVVPPLFADPLRRHVAFVYVIVILTVLQILFFIIKLGGLDSLGFSQINTLALLKMTVSVIMILVLLAVQRINVGIINELLEEYKNNDEVFISRPPRYNLAIFTITVFMACEFWLGDNTILGWLALAAGAAILNIINDFFTKDTIVLKLPLVGSLMAVLILMALGYGLMGFDFLSADYYAINHFRHLLTTGALGLAYLLVFSVVAMEHTGRHVHSNRGLRLAISLILLATLLRILLVWLPEYAQWLYLSSALCWAAAFGVYLIVFSAFFLNKRADGFAG